MSRIRPLLRLRPLLGLLVLTLILQGLGTSVLGALGRNHVHRTAAQEQALDWSIVDRVAAPAAAKQPHAHAAFGLFHADAPARHHHAPADSSVVSVDPLLDTAGDEIGSAAGLAGLIAVLPSVLAWPPHEAAGARAACAAWPALTYIPDPPERPPRTA